jgi:beta-lactamase regulating signal transducer with metallopeptidase domain
MRDWLILHTATVAVLAGAAVLVGRRLAPAARHLLWLVVLVKLLTPPLLVWPWGLPTPMEATEPEAIPAPQSPAETGVLLVLLPAGEAPPPVLEVEPAAPPPTPAVPWEHILSQAALLAWIFGGLAVAIVQGGRIVALRRRLTGAAAAPPELLAEVARAAAELGVRPSPAVRVLAGLASPMLCGWGAPQLLWPAGLECELDAEGRRSVLVHELAHLRRRDHWTAWLALAGGCVWWWHPLYWFVRARLAREAELACDAWVVATMPHGRRAYAEALLAVALRGSWMAGVGPALGAAGSRRDLERRLIMIMRDRPVCRLSLTVAAGAVALAVLALPAWTLRSFGQQPTIVPADGNGQPLPPPLVRQAPPPMHAQDPAIAVQQAEDPARAKKIHDLEERIRELAKQLRELRGEQPAAAMMPTITPPQAYYQPVTTVRDGKAVTTYQLVAPPPPGQQVANEVMLSRAIHKVPAGKAEVVAKFLSENVKAVVLETKVDGNTVIITTTPEAQRTVAHFVTLLWAKDAKEMSGTPR